ncbi:MAG: S8 family serine peptidase [Actinomycetota bacterium]
MSIPARVVVRRCTLLVMAAMVVGVVPPAASAAPMHLARLAPAVRAELASDGPGASEAVIVSFADSVPDDLVELIGTIDVRYRYRTIDAIAARMTAAQVRVLRTVPGVVEIATDAPMQASLDTARAAFGSDAAMTDFSVTGNNPDGACPEERDYCADDVTVAVIDTGIDAGHVDLDGGKVIGFVDCISSGATCTSTTPYDDNSHGTHVSSIIAGEGDGDATLHGVAPGASLVGVKVLNGSGSGSTSTVDAGVEWVIANKAAYGIDEINLSLGTSASPFYDGTETTSRLVNQATAAGITVFIAAGNDGPSPGTVGSPGVAEFAVTVGAMADPGDVGGTFPPGFSLAYFSSRGPTPDDRIKPDIAAAGVDIEAAAANTTNGYKVLSGTSMATPFAAGVGALVLSADPGLVPSGTSCPDSDPTAECDNGVEDATMTDPLKDLLTGTAVDWGPAGKDDDFGSGRLDAYAAVSEASAGVTVAGAPTLPAHQHVDGSLGGPGASTAFDVPVTGTTDPLALTLIMTSWISSSNPNFDVTVRDPDGNSVASATTSRRQETIGFLPAVTGTYSVQITSASGSGPFSLDASYDGDPIGVSPSLSVGTTGSGAVASSPGGINCGATCFAYFDQDTPVTLTATPLGGSRFAGWGGDCSGLSLTCLVVIDQARSVSADFISTPLVRVSITKSGTQGNQPSSTPSVSQDGGSIAFASTASNLVPGDTNARGDIFVKDRQTGDLTRVVNGSGVQPNGTSSAPSISGNGRYVAFISTAANLVAGDTNSRADVFRADMSTSPPTILRVSTSAGGGQATNNSATPSISADGQFVAFSSTANNLVPGDTNARTDVFVKNTATGAVVRMVSTSGVQPNNNSAGPSISGNGQYVAFTSSATNLVPGDTNARDDVFVADATTSPTTVNRVDVGPGAVQANNTSSSPDISADGTAVTFVSSATNLVTPDTNARLDVFVQKLASGLPTGPALKALGAAGAQANNSASTPVISGDGGVVAFASAATNLVPGDTNARADIFGFDTATGMVSMLSTSTSGALANQMSSTPAISADGLSVAFGTTATNLVSLDTNNRADILVKGPLA